MNQNLFKELASLVPAHEKQGEPFERLHTVEV